MESLLEKHRIRAAKYAPRYAAARAAYRAERETCAAAKRGVEHARNAQQIVQEVAQQVQQNAHDRIASVVSQCLIAVFPVPYEFKILFERSRGRTQARLIFKRGALELEPLDAAGGGAVDIAAFALRVACLILSRPPLRRVLILDEPFSHIKPPAELAPRVCKMLEMLADQFGLQIILIPSIEDFFEIGRVIKING